MAIKNSWLRNRNKPSSNVDEDIWAVGSLSVKSAAKSTSVEETEKQTPAPVQFAVDAREEEENPSELNSDQDDVRNTEDLADDIPQAEHEVVEVQEEGITFIRLNSEPDERNAEEDLVDETPLAEHEVVKVEEEDILRFFVKEEHKTVKEEETDDDDAGEIRVDPTQMPSQGMFGCLPDADGNRLVKLFGRLRLLSFEKDSEDKTKTIDEWKIVLEEGGTTMEMHNASNGVSMIYRESTLKKWTEEALKEEAMAGSTAVFNAATNAATYVASEGGKAIVAGSIALSNAAVQANEAVANMIFRSDDDESIEVAPFEPVVFGPVADYVSQKYDDAGMALAKASDCFGRN